MGSIILYTVGSEKLIFEQRPEGDERVWDDEGTAYQATVWHIQRRLCDWSWAEEVREGKAEIDAKEKQGVKIGQVEIL